MMSKSRLVRALLLASVSAPVLALTPALAASVTVANGQTVTTTDSVSGTDAVTIAKGGSFTVASGSAVTWSAAATGSGIVINNAGTLSSTGTGSQTYVAPNGTFVWDGPSAIAATLNGVAGPVAITNDGLISSSNGLAIFTGSSGAGSSVTITNNATGVITGNGGGKLNANTIPSAVAMYLGNGVDVLNNYGKINGAVLMGPGDDIVNMYNGAFDAINGAINGNVGNNTINLLDPNGGYARGHSEASNNVSTFVGWDAIQVLNVQKGNWNVVGEGTWTNLNIASGTSLNFCDSTACKPAGQTAGTGFAPFAGGTIADNGTLTFTTDNSVPWFHVPQGADIITGAGALVYAGTGVNYLQSSMTLTGYTGAVSVTGGKLVVAAILNNSISIANGAILQVGSGGNLINRDGVAVDDGTKGAVNLSGTNAITVAAGGTLTSVNGATMTWNANATGAGIAITNAGTISNTATGTQTYVAPNGTFVWDGPAAIAATNGVTGAMTIVNDGTISSTTGPAIFTGPSGATSSVTITNNAGGTISGTAGGKLNANIIPASVAMYLGNGADVLNNYGKIIGAVLMGPGDDIINMYNGAFDAIAGAINGNVGNNTINLLDPNGGYAKGHSEASNNVSTFVGWDAIQVLNVQKGNWNVVGEGTWTSLNIASGTSLNFCDAAACKPAGQTAGTGFAPFAGGTIADNGTLTFTTENTKPWFHIAQGADSITGAGALVYAGTGVNYLQSNMTLTGYTGAVSVTGGKLVVAAILNNAISIANGATLQVGSGGNLINRDGVAVDDGTKGAVNLSGANAITVAAGGTLTSVNGPTVTWSGNATGAGIAITNAGTISNTATGAQTNVAPNGTFTWDGPAAILASNGVTGVMTIVNDGVISSATGLAIATAPAGTGGSLTITNNAAGVITGTGGGKLNTTVLAGPVAMYLGNGADVLNNYGKINGTVFLGPGDDVVNIYNGALNAIDGKINGNLGNDTINLRDPNGGYLHGHTEGTGGLVNGWDSIETVNVVVGNWTLIGGGAWNSLNIAAGTSVTDCDSAVCMPSGIVIQDPGLNPFPGSAGMTIADNGTLTFTSDATAPYFHSDAPALTLTGTGALVYGGTGINYLPANMVMTGYTGAISVTGGTLVLAGTINGITVASGATLQIGSGGALKNRVGVLVDDGTTGAVTGNITDNGTVAFNRANADTFGGAITGSGQVTKTGAGTTTLSGSIAVPNLRLSAGILQDSGSITGAVQVDSGAKLVIGAGTSGTVTGNIVDNGVVGFGHSDNYIYAGNISGSGEVDVLTGAVQTFTGNIANTGTTIVGPSAPGESATLQIGSGGTTGNISSGQIQLAGTLSLNHAATAATTVSSNIADGSKPGFLVHVNGITTLSGNNSYTGGTTVQAGTLILTGSNAAPATIASGATLQIGNGGTTAGLTGAIVDAGTVVFNRSNAFSFAGALSGAGKLVQSGTGNTTLTNLTSFTGSVDVQKGTLSVGNPFKPAGTASFNVASGATLAETAANLSLIQWSGNATGAGIVITNAGTINGANIGGGTPPSPINAPGLITASGVTSGTLTLVNTGTMQTFGQVVNFGSLPAGTNVVINNSGTISNTGTTVSFTQNGTTVTQPGLSTAIAAGLSGANFTITNSGTIHGSIGLGSGTNVFNLVTGSAVIGNLGGSGTNTVNLSGTGNGIVMGKTEGPAGLPFTFYGQGNIQTMNVNSGSWTLVGGGYYNSLNIAAGATLRVCDVPGAAACASGYNGANGTPTDSGLGALGTNLAVVNNGTLVNETNSTAIHYDAAITASLSGSGKYIVTGTGTSFLGASNAVSVKDIEVAGGKLISSADIISAIVIDSGATFQIGTGGTLKDANGVVIDNGMRGNVTGSIVDNGTLVFNRLDDFTVAADLSGTGGIVKMNSDKVTLTGKYTFTGTTQLLGGTVQVGNLSPNSQLQVGSGTAVNLGGTSQTVAGLSDAPAAGSGTGTGTGTSTTPAATVDLGGGALTVNQTTSSSFSGTLTGTGTLTVNGAGTGTGTGTSGSTLVLNGNSASFTGTTNVTGGTLQVGSSSAPTAALGGSVNVTGGKLEVGDANASGAKLAGSVAVANGGSLGGHGTVTGSVSNAGTTAPGGSIGTLTVGGNYAFASGAALEQEVAANGTADKLVVGGTVTIAGNTTMNVVATDPATSYGRVTNYTIITGAGGVSGTFTAVNSSAASLTPIVSYGSNAVNLALVRTDVNLNTLGVTANQKAVGTALSAQTAGAMFRAIAPLADSALPAALNSLAGEIHASLRSALIEDGRVIRDSIMSRIATAGDAVAVWGQGFARYGELNATANASSVHHNESGFVGGIDGAVMKGLRMGAGGAAVSQSLNANGRATGTSKHVFGYANYAADNVSVSLGGDYGWGDMATARSVASLAQTLAGRRDTETGLFFGDIGWRIALGRGHLEPYASIAWQSATTGAFTETGGSAALSGTSTRDSQAYSTVGMRAAGNDWDMGGVSLRPTVDFGWQHAFDRMTPSQALAFAGTSTSFITAGAPLGTDAGVVRVGVDVSLSASASFTLGYDGEFGSQAFSHGVRGGLEWRF